MKTNETTLNKQINQNQTRLHSNQTQSIRINNNQTQIHTWDPTPISQETIDKENGAHHKKKIIHTNKAYDPSNKSLTFYTIDPTKRCYSLENFAPEKLVDQFTVECTSLASIKEDLGSNVDLIKFDIEGIEEVAKNDPQKNALKMTTFYLNRYVCKVHIF